MKQIGGILILVIVLLVVATVGGAFYVVKETEQVILTMFGKPVGEPVTTPGLKMKIPFLQKANFFDRRFLEWDGSPNQMTTRDKRFIYVDSFARWRITDPLKFFQRLHDERGAQSRLDDILDGETRSTIAKHDLIEAVRSSNREFTVSADTPEPVEAATHITFGRGVLEAEVLANSQKRTADLGLEILDFRIKRLSYEEGVQREVFNRMISERKRIAEQYRSEGAGEAARINGEKERELQTITSEAYRQAQEIRGKADAQAADIYARAYNQDPELFRFLKTMQVYRESLPGETTLLLGTEGEFLRFLKTSR